MMRTSELAERVKRDKTRRKKSKKTSQPTERARADSRHRQKLKRQRESTERMKASAAMVGKVTASGRRICMWENCNTILSVYNSQECCSNHQADWSMRRGINFANL